ncbi:MAG: hypothetical protein D3910_16735 [Candidatus Electrothrix sp. ATG2]|nr:hypothetical protein [Candidatus Electrothrix sp. ATG2]
MFWVRIYATMIDDGDHQADKQETIVVMTRLHDDYRIDRSIQGFGYVQEYTEESDSYVKYPFIFDAQNRGQRASLNYEGWDPDSITEINILDKKVREEEVFTLFVDREEYVYRIDHVTVL